MVGDTPPAWGASASALRRLVTPLEQQTRFRDPIAKAVSEQTHFGGAGLGFERLGCARRPRTES